MNSQSLGMILICTSLALAVGCTKQRPNNKAPAATPAATAAVEEKQQEAPVIEKSVKDILVETKDADGSDLFTEQEIAEISEVFAKNGTTGAEFLKGVKDLEVLTNDNGKLFNNAREAIFGLKEVAAEGVNITWFSELLELFRNQNAENGETILADWESMDNAVLVAKSKRTAAESKELIEMVSSAKEGQYEIYTKGEALDLSIDALVASENNIATAVKAYKEDKSTWASETSKLANFLLRNNVADHKIKKLDDIDKSGM